MSGRDGEETLGRLRQQLSQAAEALETEGAGARGNLECRFADLQQQFLTTPARDLAGVEARLVVIRDLVQSLGTGYLLDLVNTTLEDVRSLRGASSGDRA